MISLPWVALSLVTKVVTVALHCPRLPIGLVTQLVTSFPWMFGHNRRDERIARESFTDLTSAVPRGCVLVCKFGVLPLRYLYDGFVTCNRFPSGRFKPTDYRTDFPRLSCERFQATTSAPLGGTESLFRFTR